VVSFSSQEEAVKILASVLPDIRVMWSNRDKLRAWTTPYYIGLVERCPSHIIIPHMMVAYRAVDSQLLSQTNSICAC